MDIEYFTNRPPLSAVVQLTEENRGDLIAHLNEVFPQWQVTATSDGFSFNAGQLPGSATFGQFVQFVPEVYSGSGTNLGASDDDPRVQPWIQDAPEGATYAFETGS